MFFPHPDFKEWAPRVLEETSYKKSFFKLPTDEVRAKQKRCPIDATRWDAFRVLVALYFGLLDPRIGHWSKEGDGNYDYDDRWCVAYAHFYSPAHYEYGGSGWTELHVDTRWWRFAYNFVKNSSV